nr:vasodilator-stimulated phosphoprotein-like [Taeniopygia guttata]
MVCAARGGGYSGGPRPSLRPMACGTVSMATAEPGRPAGRGNGSTQAEGAQRVTGWLVALPMGVEPLAEAAAIPAALPAGARPRSPAPPPPRSPFLGRGATEPAVPGAPPTSHFRSGDWAAAAIPHGRLAVSAVNPGAGGGRTWTRRCAVRGWLSRRAPVQPRPPPRSPRAELRDEHRSSRSP